MIKKFLKFLGPKGIFLLAIFSLLFIFALQNSEPISVRFLFWEILELPKLYLALGAFFFGLVSGIVCSSYFSKRSSKEVTTL